MWEVGEDLHVKVSPDEFREPGPCPDGVLLGRSRCNACHGLSHQLPDADGAKPQVHRQVGGPAQGGKVAGCLVVIDSSEEVLQQGLGVGLRALCLEVVSCCRIESERIKAWHGGKPLVEQPAF